MARILVVDDLPLIRDPIAALLRERGHQADTAANGREALVQVSTCRPDLILLDMLMPQMDGLGFMRALRARPDGTEIPIILLSTESNRQKVVEAAKLGVRDYIIKTNFTAADLMRRVERLLTPVPQGNPAASPPEPPAAVPQQVADQKDRARSATSLAEAAAPKRITTRTELTERLTRASGLRGFSPALQQLGSLAGDRQSAEEVSRIVRQDPALVARLLGLANSSLYSRGAAIDTVQKAVQRIGFAQVRNAALSLQVIDGFRESLAGGRLQAGVVWEHCIATGLIASELATLLKAPAEECEGAFTTGLLHDCGRMALAQVLGDEYSQVLDHAAAADVPLELAEAKMLQMSHADAAKVMLSAWRLPGSLVRPIAMHHLPDDQLIRAADGERTAVVLALADRLAKAMALGDSGNPTLYPLRSLLAALELDPAKVESTLASVADRTAELKCVLLASAGHPSSGAIGQSPGDSWAAAIIGKFMTFDDPVDLDEIGLLLRRAACGSSSGSVAGQVGIVNLCDRKLTAKTVERLRAADAAARSPIPVVVVRSALGDVIPSELRQRPQLLPLTAPVRLEALSKAILSLATRNGGSTNASAA